MSADPELGLVYAGVELPPTDLNGIERHGNALFSESVVALDIETGVRKWHYQLTHHGLWDFDIPCAAILCDLRINGRTVKALAQPQQAGLPLCPEPRDRQAGAGRSRNSRCPRATCPANGILPPSRCPPSRLRCDALGMSAGRSDRLDARAEGARWPFPSTTRWVRPLRPPPLSSLAVCSAC